MKFFNAEELFNLYRDIHKNFYQPTSKNFNISLIELLFFAHETNKLDMISNSLYIDLYNECTIDDSYVMPNGETPYYYCVDDVVDDLKSSFEGVYNNIQSFSDERFECEFKYKLFDIVMIGDVKHVICAISIHEDGIAYVLRNTLVDQNVVYEKSMFEEFANVTMLC